MPHPRRQTREFHWDVRHAAVQVMGKLDPAVLAEHAKAAGGAGEDDAARKMFKKRLKRLDGVTIKGKMVKLGS